MDVDALLAVFVVQVAEVLQRLGGHRQREPRHDRDVQQRGPVVAGVGGMPLVDLGPGEADRLLLRGQQRLGGVTADGLDAAAGHDTQPGLLGLGEQGILGVGEGGTEHHHRRRTRGDPSPGELDRGGLGEFGVGELGFGWEDTQIEPFEQLPAAVGVAGVGLREVDVGVDEARDEIPARVLVRLRAREFGRELGSLAGEFDRAVVADHQSSVGYRHQRVHRLGDRGTAGEMEDVPVVDGVGHRCSSGHRVTNSERHRRSTRVPVIVLGSRISDAVGDQYHPPPVARARQPTKSPSDRFHVSREPVGAGLQLPVRTAIHSTNGTVARQSRRIRSTSSAEWIIWSNP